MQDRIALQEGKCDIPQNLLNINAGYDEESYYPNVFGFISICPN